MKNVLLDKGIILPSGEISKDKVNLVTGAITQPFAEMVWVTTGGDMETVNRLTDVLVTMNTPADRGKLFKIIKMLYGLMGLPFSEEAEPMLRHTRAMHLYQDGVPLAMVSEFLGHAQIETTKIYAHADTEMKRKAIQQAANKLNDTIPDALWNTDDEEMMLKLRGKQQYK